MAPGGDRRKGEKKEKEVRSETDVVEVPESGRDAY